MRCCLLAVILTNGLVWFTGEGEGRVRRSGVAASFRGVNADDTVADAAAAAAALAQVGWCCFFTAVCFLFISMITWMLLFTG